MRIYLAARHSRREELCGYADELRKCGHEITARWLLGSHKLSGVALAVESASGSAPSRGAAFAREDLQDLMRADAVISFTEVPRSGHSRSGRHVEFGMAFAMHKRLIVIGPRENVFHCLSAVERYESWEDFKTQVRLPV